MPDFDPTLPNDVTCQARLIQGAKLFLGKKKGFDRMAVVETRIYWIDGFKVLYAEAEINTCHTEFEALLKTKIELVDDVYQAGVRAAELITKLKTDLEARAREVLVPKEM